MGLFKETAKEVTMLSIKKFRGLLGKEYDSLSDDELQDLMGQLAQMADIYIDLSTNEDGEDVTESVSPCATKGGERED